ncbi:hypothetical protein ASE67_10050 [Sphingomonas sp. Leaf23]|jgi:hypothetical protein|uniref:hypothetical protein n=1 Tax=Sphingomonas sp. Leaf23 TaxID=1735689 RepID=UPI0006F9FB3A|nr:hypothetical protein [Sphingomonas sp. Leaf23]KQM86184.1 hypothetical protein ASE67_10050 [Sphingomonas sp. Leaf23]
MLRIALSLSCALGVAGCSLANDCSSGLIHKAYDPGSDRYAVVEERDCGATTGKATVVRVGRASRSPDAAVEVFVADDDHGLARAMEFPNMAISVVWRRPGELSIAFDSKARVFRRLPTAEGARISYISTEPIAFPGVP